MNDPQPQEKQPEQGKPRVPHGKEADAEAEKKVREQQGDPKRKEQPEPNRPSQ